MKPLSSCTHSHNLWALLVAVPAHHTTLSALRQTTSSTLTLTTLDLPSHSVLLLHLDNNGNQHPSQTEIASTTDMLALQLINAHQLHRPQSGQVLQLSHTTPQFHPPPFNNSSLHHRLTLPSPSHHLLSTVDGALQVPVKLALRWFPPLTWTIGS